MSEERISPEVRALLDKVLTALADEHNIVELETAANACFAALAWCLSAMSSDSRDYLIAEFHTARVDRVAGILVARGRSVQYVATH
jgi:hypothetical protein